MNINYNKITMNISSNEMTNLLNNGIYCKIVATDGKFYLVSLPKRQQQLLSIDNIKINDEEFVEKWGMCNDSDDDIGQM